LMVKWQGYWANYSNNHRPSCEEGSTAFSLKNISAKWVIRIDGHTRATHQRWLRQQKTSLGLARCARSLLLLEQGLSSVSTARQVGLTERNLRK